MSANKSKRSVSVKHGGAATSPVEEERDALPFFKPGKRGGSWWSVHPTGDYEADHETGRGYALALLPLMRVEVAGPATIPWIVGDMMAACSRRRGDDRFSGIEVGFLSGLGDIIAAGHVAAVLTPTRYAARAEELGCDPRVDIPVNLEAIKGVGKLIGRIVQASWDRERIALVAAVKANTSQL